jgi:hypothetical protein
MINRVWRSAVLAVVLLALVVQGAGAAPPPAPKPIPVPADGTTYFGVQLAWDVDTPAGYSARLGRAPAVYGEYVRFPLDSPTKAALSVKVDRIRGMRGMLMLTLEPHGGLATVTTAAIRDLGAALADYNARGVGVFVRFAHEMNGSWYAWGQQPAAYVQAFQKVASGVHRDAPGSAMVWAPNYGGGYPFSNGGYNARPGTAAFAALDTNRDGQLTMDDDPYGPYYPGDASVDWVGLTSYHWGNAWPWGENELPEAGRFAAQLTGTYAGLLGDERGVPDFYATYAVAHNKPFAIAETAALYNPGRSDGASNYDIKLNWANQLFASSIATQFPRLKMLLWFEHLKEENGSTTVDWRVTADPTVLAGFQAALPARYLFAAP